MDTRLASFLILCQVMNYRQTAQILHITQPALTKQIQSLEGEYGVRLFTYDGRHLRQTQAGAKMEAYAKAQQYHYQELRRSLLEQQERQLRIGASKTIGEFVLEPYVINYLARPEARLSLIIENTQQLLQRLDHNELDFLVLEGIFPKERYGYSLWRQEPFIGICSRDCPLNGAAVDLEDLFQYRLLLREQGSGTRRLLERELEDRGYSLDSFTNTSSLSSLKLLTQAVAANLGISFVYSSVKEPALGSFTVPSFQKSHEFNLVYLKNTAAETLIEKFFTQEPV